MTESTVAGESAGRSAEEFARHSLWHDLKAALRGSGHDGASHDFTKGPIGRAIFLLAVPMVLEMAMESLFALSDIFFVSQLGDPDAIATVGLAESLMIVVYTIAMGLSIPATAIVARRIGEGQHDGAARAAVQAITLALVVSSVIGGVGAWFADDLLRLMGAEAGVLEKGTTFTRIMLAGSATPFLLFIINAAFRGAGDAAVAMRVLWLANGINIVLGPLLIFGVGPFPKLGLTGAAIATTAGRGIGVLFALSRLLKGSGHLRVMRQHLAIEWGTIGQMLRMSVNGTFQVLVGSLSWILLIKLMAEFGSAAMAGYTIAVRMLMFCMMPAWGLGNAAATLVGQSLGAGSPERAEKAVWLAARYNMYFLGVMALVLFLGATPIAEAFTTDASVEPIAVMGLRIMALGFPLFALGMVMEQAFNGAGDTTTPTWINIGCFWLFEVPLAWALARFTELGPNAIYVSVVAAYSLLAAVAYRLFRRGSWKLRKV